MRRTSLSIRRSTLNRTDENVIEQRINELATAQAAQMRMRIHTEMKIRRELSPEQLATLRRLRLQVTTILLRPTPAQPLRAATPSLDSHEVSPQITQIRSAKSVFICGLTPCIQFAHDRPLF